MKILRIPLILAAFGLGTGASAQDDPLAVPDLAAPDAAPELKSLVDTCAAHKFETVVRNDRGKGSKVRICGEAGQTDAQWLVTLQSSIKQTEANESLSQAMKRQIVKALEAEIARLEGAATLNLPVTAVGLSPEPAISVAAVAPDALPPELTAPSQRNPEYSTLPPLPAPKRSVPVKLANGTVLPPTEPAKPLLRPNILVRCAIPHEGFAACARLERETRLLVRAQGDMPPGTAIRFLRGGDNRAELDLSALKKGESLSERLPSRVCAGVLRGKVEVQILTKGQVAETLGPWKLYCGS